MLEILMRGVSTREYRAVLPEMAETVEVSRSNVSREAMEASQEEKNFNDYASGAWRSWSCCSYTWPGYGLESIK